MHTKNTTKNVAKASQRNGQESVVVWEARNCVDQLLHMKIMTNDK